MKITILSIAPEQFESFLKTPLISRSIAGHLLDIQIKDIREYAPGSFRKVDDSPYGGGVGMLLRYQPLHDALIDNCTDQTHSILMAPIGKPYTQKDAHRLSLMDDLVIVCGHYEGFDERIYDEVDEIVSIGDYILCGGELPSMILCESIMRLVEGSMKKESVIEESFETNLLEYSQYTKPSLINDKKVPDILLSGNHEAIEQWHKEEALKRTKRYRPDLLKRKHTIDDVDPYLKAYIEDQILPCYRDYEKSHGIEHIRTVIKNSFELTEDNDVDVNKVYCIAAYHDIGIRYGRKDHHLTSGKWLYEDRKLRNWFTEEEITLMKEAVEDHRASSDHAPRSIYGCIVAEADRDIDPYRIIERCVIFEQNAHPGCSDDEAYDYIMKHLDEKYSRHGYLKLWMPSKKNMEGLETIRTWIETGEVKEIIDRYLKEKA